MNLYCEQPIGFLDFYVVNRQPRNRDKFEIQSYRLCIVELRHLREDNGLFEVFLKC